MARQPWVAIALCVLPFIALTVAVQTGVAGPVDVAINASLTPLRSPAVLAGSLWITAAGTEAARTAVILAASTLLWSDRRYGSLHQLWVTVLGSEVTTWAVKFLVDRPRPVFLPGVATALSPSFPSAHSAGTMALVGVLALITVRDRPQASVIAGVAASFIIAAIGLSRVVLNVHYPSDVASGFLVGALWLVIGSRAARQPNTRNRT